MEFESGEFENNKTDFLKAKSIAIRYISYKMRTKFEIRQKLNGSFNDEVIEQVVGYLEEIGYLDDELYAEKFILEKDRLRNISNKMIYYQMEKLGIERSVIEKKLYESNYDEFSHAVNCTRKYSGKDVVRLKRYLYSKGFSTDTIEKIVKQD